MKKIMLWVCLALVVSSNAFAADGAHYKIETLVKSSNSWDGTPLPEYPKGTPEIAVLKITIAPGEQLPMHKHPSINAGVLLSGELTVITEEDKVMHMKAGDALIELVDKWHYGKNEGTVPAEIFVVYASSVDKPLSIPKK